MTRQKILHTIEAYLINSTSFDEFLSSFGKIYIENHDDITNQLHQDEITKIDRVFLLINQIKDVSLFDRNEELQSRLKKALSSLRASL